MRALAILASIGRLHITAIAALGTLTFGWVFTGERLWWLAAICAVDWYVVNLLNRVVDLPEDRINGIAGTGFVSRHRRPLLWGGSLVLGGSLVGVHLVVPVLTPFRLFYHALGMSYNWPLLPGRRRIKQLYFWKNTASAVGFLVTLFAYPLAWLWYRHGWPMAFAPGVSWPTVAVTALFFLLFELSYEVTYDLRDEEGDRAADVRTYPVVHGTFGAVRIIAALLSLSALVLVTGYGLHAVPWAVLVMVAAPVLQGGLLWHRLATDRPVTSAYCVGITWLGAVLLATYHLWVVLDLPGVSR